MVAMAVVVAGQWEGLRLGGGGHGGGGGDLLP